MEVRNRRTQIRRDNSVRGSGGGEAFSRNIIHRDGRPTAVRTVCTFIYSVPTGQLTLNSPEAKLEVWVYQGQQETRGNDDKRHICYVPR